MGRSLPSNSNNLTNLTSRCQFILDPSPKSLLSGIACSHLGNAIADCMHCLIENGARTGPWLPINVGDNLGLLFHIVLLEFEKLDPDVSIRLTALLVPQAT